MNDQQPWTAYGQATSVPNGSINNPTANINGLRGEVSLPYTVPEGMELHLTSYGGEAYAIPSTAAAPQGIVYVPFIGPVCENATCLHSVYASQQSNEVTGVEFIVPAGKVLNYRIESSYSEAFVVGWFMRGFLCAAPAA